MAGSSLIKTFIVEGIRAARQKSVIATREAMRDQTRNIDKSAVTRADVAKVAHKVEDLRGSVHAAFDDVQEVIKANTDHLASQMKIVSEAVGEHSSILRDLIEVISHLH